MALRFSHLAGFFASTAFVISMLAACSRDAPPPPPAPAPEHINAAGLDIIKDIEGLRLKPYKLEGQWYVGYGHAIEKPGPAISEAEAEHLLRKDLAVCEDAVRETVSVPINGNEFSAMTSLCYNIGVPSFAKTSVVDKLNAGDRAGAANAFLPLNKVALGDGRKKTLSVLKDRREKERDLFLESDAKTASNS